MPMTVITLINAPNSLRGDLSKWMQEIAVGVYIGNFNTRIREQLWKRVTQNIGNGQATLSYSFQNELGYNFKTYNTKRMNIDFDGIPLVMFPSEDTLVLKDMKKGFSNAAKFRQISKFAGTGKKQDLACQEYVVIDIETDGLNEKVNKIIEIGAVKIKGDSISTFDCMIKYDGTLPDSIVNLTGITTQMLRENGLPIQEVLAEFYQFIENLPIIGYSINFDLNFINFNLKSNHLPIIKNKSFDLMKYVKREKIFLKRYGLNDVLGEYGLENNVEHRALSDAKKILDLSTKVKGFLNLLAKK